MTEPRDIHRDRETGATTADRELEVKPEVIKDLDVPDEEDIIGGEDRFSCPGNTCGPLSYLQT
jgi:hypothetical protein